MGLSLIVPLGMVRAEEMTGGESSSPLTVTLQPQVTTSPLPAWFVESRATSPFSASSNRVLVQPESDSVTIPVPALATLDEIGAFALTVIFEDNGDGGPVVEWEPKEGGRILLSSGLGTTGLPIGLNARTLLLTQSLDLDGGSIRVSFAGRFQRLLSLSLRPAKQFAIASLDDSFQPALFLGNDRVIGAAEVSGMDEQAKHGDSQKGDLIHAELSASPQRLDLAQGDASLEFVIPLSTPPKGSYLHTGVAGLDPSSWIKVEINGISCGALGMSSFPLDDPHVVLTDSGKLLFAGWRQASLFIPGELWKEGDNSIVLSLERGTGDGSQAVFIQKTEVDLLLPKSGASIPSITQALPSILPLLAPSPVPEAVASPSPPTSNDETLSTGSLYGNPSPDLFHATPPASLPPAIVIP